MVEKLRSVEPFLLLPSHEQMLNEKSALVTPSELQDTNFQEFIDGMLATAHDSDLICEPGYAMVGLAAPQVGFLKRVIIVDTAVDVMLQDEPQYEVLINPTILDMSTARNAEAEGCFSTAHVRGRVERADSIELGAADRNGVYSERRYYGLLARVVQHEVDHLDGIRFPERMSNDEQLYLRKRGSFKFRRTSDVHEEAAMIWLRIQQGLPVSTKR